LRDGELLVGSETEFGLQGLDIVGFESYIALSGGQQAV